MRAREFLLENYNRDQFKRKWFFKIWQRGMDDRSFHPQLHNMLKDEWLAYEQATQDKDYERAQKSVDSMDQWVTTQVQRLESADPSDDKRYMPFMMRMWTQPHGISRIEDIVSGTGLSGTLIKHFKLSGKRKRDPNTNKMVPVLEPELQNINGIKDMVHLEHWERWLEGVYNEYVAGERRNLPRGKSKELYNGPTYRVVMPEDEAAACYYGQGTRWCTAATEGENIFDFYNEQGPILIVIPKQPITPTEKYQIHPTSSQVMDERDREVWIKPLLDRFDGLDQIIKKVDSTNGHYTRDWLEFMSDDFIALGVKEWNEWSKKEGIKRLPDIVTGWLKSYPIKNAQGEIIDKKQKAELLKKLAADAILNNSITLDDVWDEIEGDQLPAEVRPGQMRRDAGKPYTGAEVQFPIVMAVKLTDNIENYIEQKYEGKLDLEDYRILRMVLRNYSQGMTDAVAEWESTAIYPKGWRFYWSEPKAVDQDDVELD